MAVDGGSGQVGPRVAELLGIPQVTAITSLTIEDGKATLIHDVEGDEETIEVSLPVLVTTQQGLNEPRYPSLPGIMKAKKKPLITLELDDLDLEEEDVEAKTEKVEVFLPPKKQQGKVLEGELNQSSPRASFLIKIRSKSYLREETMMGKKVLVLGDIRDGALRNVTFEAIAAAKLIADGGEVVAALFGESIGDEALSLIHYGADRVVKVEHSDLKGYTTDAYQQALLQVTRHRKA